MKLRAESNNALHVSVLINGNKINDVSYSSTFSAAKHGTAGFNAELNNGDSTEGIISFDKQTLVEVGIESIKSFDLSMQVAIDKQDSYDFSAEAMTSFYPSYSSEETVPAQESDTTADFIFGIMPEDVIQVEVVPNIIPVNIKTSLYDETKQDLNLDGIVLYNENGIRFTVNKSSNKTVDGINDLYFALENISNPSNIWAQITDFEVYDSDNKLIHPIAGDPILDEFGMTGEDPIEILYSESGLYAGQAAISPAIWLEEALLDTGFTDIDKLRFTFMLTLPEAYAENGDSVLDIGAYTQTVEVDFSKKTIDTLWKYDPSNIPTEEYVIDNGDGSLGEKIIFDGEGLKITVLSLTDDKEGIGIRIENSSKKAFGIYFDDTVVNGIDIGNEDAMYGYGLYNLYGLCDLSNVKPGDYIETAYSPALIEAKTNTGNVTSSGNGSYTVFFDKDTVTGELQTLSFRLIISDAPSDIYNLSVRASKNISITINGESE